MQGLADRPEAKSPGGKLPVRLGCDVQRGSIAGCSIPSGFWIAYGNSGQQCSVVTPLRDTIFNDFIRRQFSVFR
ncbi:hypothetical protein Psta_1000 [Pirellula staleyi DSM 6068]|uniref:Uncharacterized protein n=1 Tax=Pirellula staleyi (strain ATCC 27377 / DSM 6068 / ICPB 4128) TaxID=530564 RepID=D2R867_PIRSD|nr:hypothetical protein Psta_1000 [Pirellula staleyi DSM 6068]